MTATGRTRRDGRGRTGVRGSAVQDARRRLAKKQAAPVYRPPRGNPDVDQEAMDYSLGKFELVLGR
jgi:hypothetical protein